MRRGYLVWVAMFAGGCLVMIEPARGQMGIQKSFGMKGGGGAFAQASSFAQTGSFAQAGGGFAKAGGFAQSGMTMPGAMVGMSGGMGGMPGGMGCCCKGGQNSGGGGGMRVPQNGGGMQNPFMPGGRSNVPNANLQNPLMPGGSVPNVPIYALPMPINQNIIFQNPLGNDGGNQSVQNPFTRRTLPTPTNTAQRQRPTQATQQTALQNPLYLQYLWMQQARLINPATQNAFQGGGVPSMQDLAAMQFQIPLLQPGAMPAQVAPVQFDNVAQEVNFAPRQRAVKKNQDDE